MRVAQPTHERIRGNMPRLHLNLNRMIKDRGLRKHTDFVVN
jgi:hypothetical protein